MMLGTHMGLCMTAGFFEKNFPPKKNKSRHFEFIEKFGH